MVYFAGWKHHLSVYPVPAGDETFQQETVPYRSGKRFPLDQPIPYVLIERQASLLAAERATTETSCLDEPAGEVERVLHPTLAVARTASRRHGPGATMTGSYRYCPLSNGSGAVVAG